MTLKTKPRRVVGWVGMVDGNMDLDFLAQYPNYGRIFRTRREAKKSYQAVRKVIVVPAEPPK